MAEGAGDEFDGLAGVLDRLAARLGLLVGLALGFLFGLLLRGHLGLDLAPRLLLELLLGGGFGRLLAFARGGNLGSLHALLLGLEALLVLDAQLGRYLFRLETPRLGLLGRPLRLYRLRIRAAHGIVVATPAQEHEHDGHEREPETGPARRT